jgi:hypothetical protein
MLVVFGFNESLLSLSARILMSWLPVTIEPLMYIHAGVLLLRRKKAFADNEDK